MLIAACFVAATFGPWSGTGHALRNPTPPQPYTEKVTLPGKVPANAKAVLGSWHYTYFVNDAVIESGKTQLFVTLSVRLEKDGSYALFYSARWGGLAVAGSRGLNVEESGKYSLSGEVLLLEPRTTERGDIEKNTLVKKQVIANENHVWIVRAQKGRLHVAGRCAKYQVDPLCHVSPNIWFSMDAEVSIRRLGP